MKRLLFLLPLAGIAIAAACSNQGEGEVCNSENGNDDCITEENLACYPSAQLNGVTSDRCCPLDRSRATHPVCVTAVTGGGITDAEAPADTGPTATPPTVNDAGSADAQADAADARADADAQ